MNLYDKTRDPIALGKFYTDHVSAMTSEDLRKKSDIAAELAYRDQRIAALEAEKAERERQEPAAYRYKFPATWGGFVWKESPGRYNGSPPLESQALYAHPLAIREPSDEEYAAIYRNYVCPPVPYEEVSSDVELGRLMVRAVRSVLK